MTMTTEPEWEEYEFGILLDGTGTATIDWGDGSENDVMTIGIDYEEFRHTYKNATTHNITVSCDNITELNCQFNKITDLYVSNNTAMIKQKWDNCLHIIKDNVRVEIYDVIFEPIIPISIKQNILTLELSNQFFYEYIEENFVDLLTSVIRKEFGHDTKLVYCIPIGHGLQIIDISKCHYYL